MKMNSGILYAGIGLICILTPGSGLFAQELSMADSVAIGQNVKEDSLSKGGQSPGQGETLPLQTDAVSFAELLSGKAGVRVLENGVAGAAPRLMIRGLHSINLPVSPLIFVDGVPVRYDQVMASFLSSYEPTRFGFVNPNDIADAYIAREGAELSAAGGRGSNGAIYLSTDRGAFGGTRVDFSATYGILSADYAIDHMGAAQFKDYLRSYMRENGTPEEELNAHPIFDPSLPQYNNNTDWLDMLTRKASFHDYHVKLKGGDADANYMFSIGYTGKEETIDEAGLERVSLRFNLDYKLSQQFEISNNLSYANTSSNYFEQGPDWDVHPVYTAVSKAPFLHYKAYNDAGQLTDLTAGVDELGKSNPWALVNSMQNDNEDNRVDGLIKAKWTPSDGLTLNSSLAVNYFNKKEQQYRPSLGIAPDLNRIRQNAKRNSSELMLLSNTWVEKSGSWGANNHLTAQAGVWIETYEDKSVYARKINAGTDDYETLEQGTVDSASSVKYEHNLLSFYLRGTLDLSDRVHVAANINLEGSSNFGSKQRWKIYPGITASADLLPTGGPAMLSLNAGWGRSGNRNLRGAFYQNLYYPANYFGYGGAYLGNVANEDIRPEITDTYDIGLTLKLFEDRLRVNGGYYYKYTSDLITSKTVPIEIGLGPQFENSGDIASHGLELGLEATVVQQEDFNWQLYGNISTISSRIEELPNGDIIRSLGNVSGIAREQEAPGSFYGYRIKGVFQTQAEVNLSRADGTSYQAGDYIIEDLNGDAVINELDRQVIGSALPELFGSFGTSLSHRRFSLDALFTFSSGNEIYNAFNQQMHLMKDYSNQSPGVAGRWISESQPGEGLSRAALDDPSFNGVTSDRWVEDGSYLRLKRLTLSYDIPVNGKLDFFRRLRLCVTAENLLTFSDYSGLDPEVVSVADPLLRGIDFGASPLPQSFLFGLKASF